MRVELPSVEAVKEEIKSFGSASIRDAVIRYAEVNMPQQRECVTFEIAVYYTFIVDHEKYATLYESPISYGLTTKGDPRADREKEKVKLQEFCKNNGLSLRFGKIELH